MAVKQNARYLLGWWLIWASAALAQDAAPPAPQQPWRPRKLDAYEAEMTRHNPRLHPDAGTQTVDPGKVYDLPELIDLAEGNNPQTSIAWEQARQAASAVGLSKSQYYPLLAASAAARYERVFEPFPLEGVFLSGTTPGAGTATTGQTAAPFPVVPIGSSTLVTTSLDSRALLSVQWLLFDFGGREAKVAQSRAELMAANLRFNSTHQQIVYQVTQLFYALNVARQDVKVARVNLQNARTVLEFSQARLNAGLSTQTDLLQAKQQEAQADFDLQTAEGNAQDSQLSLVNALGILPTTELQVADILAKPQAADLPTSVDALVDRALAHRPDLVALLANVHAKRSAVRSIQAEYYPKLSLTGLGGYADLNTSANGTPYISARDYAYSIVLSLDWKLFDGFAREERLRIAESQLREAEAEIAQARDAVVREVWQASIDFRTAFQRQTSSARSLAAAKGAFAAALKSYQQGLAPYPDVVNTERALTLARGVDVQTRAAIFTRAAALACAVGDLSRPTPPAHTPLPPRLPAPAAKAATSKPARK